MRSASTAYQSSALRNLVRGCIERHADQNRLRHLRLIEAAEREQLSLFGQQVTAVGMP